MSFKISDLWTDATGKFDLSKAMGTAGGAAAIYGALNPDSGIGQFIGAGSNQQPVGYTGGIPEYTVSRSLEPNAFATNTGQVDPTTGAPIARRPGSTGRSYFTPTTYTPTGGTMTGGTPTSPASNDTSGIFSMLPEEAVTTLLTSIFGGGVGAKNTQRRDQAQVIPRRDQVIPLDVSTYTSAYRPTGDALTYARASEGPARYDWGDTREEALSYATEAMADRSISPGEAGNLFSAAYHGGVNPADMASALGIPESDVLNYLRTEMPHLSYNYLQQYGYAKGGLASLPQSKGYYLGGATDGMADQVPASIDNREPAALSDGEFVIPADVVSHLGNGNSNAGAQELYAMMDKVRKDRTGTTAQGTQIKPKNYLPA